MFGFIGMIIDDFALARALHVLALVHWIGGVAMVTTIVLPRARALADARAALPHATIIMQVEATPTALRDKERAFVLAIRLHAAALMVSGIAIIAGVLGAHGALP